VLRGEFLSFAAECKVFRERRFSRRHPADQAV
jgi:hypothetical protein